jgi:quercetin dioxygenase-like cupin family protein
MTASLSLIRDASPDPMAFGSIRWLARPSSTGARQLTVMDVELAPGKAHGFHFHPDQEETIYVVAGRLEQWIGEERHLFRAGDSVFIPAGLVHGSYNTGTEPVRMIVVFGPCVGDGFASVEVADQAPWNRLRAGAAAA